MTTRCAVITVAHGRHDHLARQEAGLARMEVGPDVRCVVALDDPAISSVAGPGSVVVPCASDGGALPIARARNAGARRALDLGAQLLVFLDVDCIPSPTLVADYTAAHHRVGGDALLCGPVTYLQPSSTGYRLDDLEQLTDPHPARPAPPPGRLTLGHDYNLFWSLSFAVSAAAWTRIGGFSEQYTGYGGEDTDFAAIAEASGVPLMWVGGAHAYHQHHPVSDPPVEHLADIVANARVFHRRWGRWPMTGWLDAFERAGLIRRSADEITEVQSTPAGV